MPRRIIFETIILMLLIVTIGIKYNKVAAATPGTIVVPSPGYETIQKAINAANFGDVIRVSAGIYNENLLVNKTVSIIGENASTTVIDGGNVGNVITILSPNVVIDGFTLQNGKSEVYPYWGISIYMCNSATIKNNVLRNNYYGVQLTRSNKSRIFNNLILNNSYAGIYIHDNASNNVFFENDVQNNSVYGLWSQNSQSNIFYHNNFINNTYQTGIFNSPTILDDGAEGNYWSDYKGVDANPRDGIADSKYLGDNYPLMGVFKNFTFTYKSQTYFLSTICNSTISNFQFDESHKKISFNVSGQNATRGFCRIATFINHTVLVDDNAPSYFRNWTISQKVYGYFIYEHTNASREVTIGLKFPEDRGSSPFPIMEMVVIVIILIVVMLTILVLIIKKKKKGR
jgi:parallel beta-helix repeat protein